jgi:hypothetical protein
LHQSRERRGSLSSYSATDEKVVPTGYKYRNRRRHDSSTSGTSDDDYSYYYDDSDEGTSAETHRPLKGWHMQMQDQIQRGMGLLDSAPWQPRKVERKSLLAKAAPVPMRIKTSSRLPEATTATTTTTTTTTTPVAANRQKQAIRDEQSSLTPRHTAVLATPQYFSFETQDRYRGKKDQRRARKQANDEADLPISIIPVASSQPHSEPVLPLVAVPPQLPLSLQTKVEADASTAPPEVAQDLVSGSWTVSASSTVEVMLTTPSTEAAATLENKQDEKNVVPIATPAIGQQESQAEDEEVCIQTLSSAVASQYGEIEVVSDKDDEAVASTASIVEDVPEQEDPETAAPVSDSASDATPNNHEQAVDPIYSNVEADTAVSLDSNVSDVIEFNPGDGPSPQISPTGSTSRDLVDIFASDSPVDPDDIVVSPCPSSPPESLLPASSTSSSSLRVSSSSFREGGSENSSHVSRKQRSSSRAVQSPTNRRAFRAADV